MKAARISRKRMKIPRRSQSSLLLPVECLRLQIGTFVISFPKTYDLQGAASSAYVWCFCSPFWAFACWWDVCVLNSWNWMFLLFMSKAQKEKNKVTRNTHRWDQCSGREAGYFGENDSWVCFSSDFLFFGPTKRRPFRDVFFFCFS